MLTKFNSVIMLRATAIISICMGILYYPAVMDMYVPYISPGIFIMDGQNYVVLWSSYAISGGVMMFLGSFFINRMTSVFLRRLVLSTSFVAGAILIVAQLPALFWWILVSAGSFSWSGVMFFVLHMLVLVVALWQALVTIYAFELSGKEQT